MSHWSSRKSVYELYSSGGGDNPTLGSLVKDEEGKGVLRLNSLPGVEWLRSIVL